MTKQNHSELIARAIDQIDRERRGEQTQDEADAGYRGDEVGVLAPRPAYHRG